MSATLHSVGHFLSNTTSSVGHALVGGWEAVSNVVQHAVLPFFKSIAGMIMNHQRECLLGTVGLTIGAGIAYLLRDQFTAAPAAPAAPADGDAAI